MADSPPSPARLAVLGSPIAHSKSPALHTAAYRMLDLDWSYDAIEVPSGGLSRFLGGLGSEWRGLSLTMPLKREIFDIPSDWRDPNAELTGQANTVLFDAGTLRIYNTDVQGLIGALGGVDAPAVPRATVLGGGATAESAVIALRQLGISSRVAVRSPERAARIASVAPVVPLDEVLLDDPLVISTLPPGADFTPRVPTSTADAVLLDVAYEPWPTRLGAEWAANGGTVIHGLEMLIHQAVIQIRIFVSGDPDTRLPQESAVLQAMRAAVGRS